MPRYIDADELKNQYREILKPQHQIDLIRVMDDFVNSQPTIDAGTKWISVKERLPEEYTKALVATEDGQMLVAAYTSDGWMYPCYGEKPTHWMPLPEPPEVEE